MDELNASDFTSTTDEIPEINMASLDDLRCLRESLGFMKTQVVEFNNLCDEGGFCAELAKIPS